MDSFSSSTGSSIGANASPPYDYEPEEKIARKSDYIPISRKIQILNLVASHPKWKLQTIQSHGGGGKKEKYDQINEWTLDRFKEARNEKKPVTTRMLLQWGTQAALQYESEDFHFVASESWVTRLKASNRICQRKVTRYIKSINALDTDTIISEATKFQKRISKIITKFDLNFVINTDQTGCEYRSDVRRSLSGKGEKLTEVFIGDFNKVTHSYTAQYTVTATGKLLPRVFLCMQEPKGQFGPRVKRQVTLLSEKFGNIYVTASKSGKLTKQHFNEFVAEIMKPYCEDSDFLLILDSWGGQTDISLFNSHFTDDDGNCTATVEVIPPHCTPFCQPCDVYFFRQVKNFIKKFKTVLKFCKAIRNYLHAKMQ
ncbi:hypothetical protein ALC57_03184 [Trachymyrmex cornetzi]|uniref:HTH CENPB-type domain-containing protein n=1 Tax=Trachymyrmex cornetzi TaxID=471704 RepID=A0A151JME5_9HYME|nr:hypothetical protein ALC57_03184 [Trachymyrmex cornetzi]